MITLLAIDDKEDNLITISALLKNLLPEVSVLLASSGLQGIDMALQQKPDTIILDVKMPGMDGFETCRRLKENNETKHIPVILLTAIRTDVDSRIRGLELGADAFLTKPIDETELVAQINVMLRIKRAEDILRNEKDLLEQLVRERTAELYQSLEKLKNEKDFIKSLEDASPAYYVALDTEGLIITMNRSLLEATGYAINEVVGRPYFSKFYLEANVESEQKIFESILQKRKKTINESVIIARDGSKKIVEWHGRPFLKDDTDIDFVFFVGVDITERRSLEKVIISSSETERHRIGQELHEGLAQHLAAIAFKGEILKLKLKNSSIENIGDIDDIIQLAGLSIDHARDLARVLFPVGITGGGLHSAFEDLKQEIENKHNVVCLVTFDENININNDMELSNIYYIVKESINNSIIHGKAKNIIITGSLENDMIKISVTDDGIGIPEDIDDHEGLGINIMHYRAWLIGASLEIKRIEHGGTSVMVTISNQLVPEKREVVAENIKKRYLVCVDENNKSRILIVDSHPIVRQGLTQIINGESDLIVCGEASNANDAIRLIATHNPHLVVSDINLSGASGIDLVKAVKNRYSGLPVLILSIHDESIYAERSIRAGARGYVMKQENPSTIIDAIRTVIKGKQYLRESVKEKILDNISYDDFSDRVSPLQCLTDREFQIFQLIGEGKQNRVIADILQISVKTVENYRERIKNKLHLSSAGDLFQFAVNWILENKKSL